MVQLELATAAKLFDTRAGKLLLEGKPFLVVKLDEEYAPHVYRSIRNYEKANHTWTEQDEDEFQRYIGNKE